MEWTVGGHPRERKPRGRQNCEWAQRSWAQQMAGLERKPGPRRPLWANLRSQGIARRALGALGEWGVSCPRVSHMELESGVRVEAAVDIERRRGR